jgi:hypothetical protein
MQLLKKPARVDLTPVLLLFRKFLFCLQSLFPGIFRRPGGDADLFLFQGMICQLDELFKGFVFIRQQGSVGLGLYE